MRRPEAVVLCAVTSLAAILRFWGLGAQEYWFDEAVTVGLLELGFGEMLDRVPESESTPPLYYVVAWLWAQPMGTGEAALRSLSALCGTAAIPAVYAAGRILVDRRAALAAAALTATSPVLVWYSQEARAYGLLTLLAALSLWLLARCLDRPRTRDLALWAGVCALALTTHYFALFIVVPEAIWLIARLRRRSLGALAGVGLAGLALLPLALDQRAAGFASFIADDPLPRRIALTVKQLALGYDSPLEPVTAALAAAVAGAGLVLAGWRYGTGGPRGVLAALTVGSAGLVLPWLLALTGLDYVLARNSIAVWPPMAVAVAAGLTWRRTGWAGIAVVVAICVLATACVVGVQVEPDWQRGDWGRPAP